MPTAGDLYCVLRQGLPRVRHMRHLGHGRLLRSSDEQRARNGRSRLTIRQQGEDPALFQVADNASVPVIAPPSIVNANVLERVSRPMAGASERAQECVRCRPAASTALQSPPPVDNQALSQADEPALPRGAPMAPVRLGEALGEDLASVQDRIAAEATSVHLELDDTTLRAVDRSRGVDIGLRTRRLPHDGHRPRLPEIRSKTSTLSPSRSTLSNPRHQTGAVESLLHGVDLLQSKRQTSPRPHQK